MAIYLDNAATTRMRPEAVAAYVEQAQRAGNPSSVHAAGQDARFTVEMGRAEVARSVGADAAEVIFTSGGTESINIAIKGTYWKTIATHPERRFIIAPEGEHHATLDSVEWLEQTQGAQVLWARVDRDGRVRLDDIEEFISEHPGQVALLTTMLANNEVGTVQPVSQIAALARSAGIPVHLDAVSAYGQLPLDFHRWGVQAMSVAAHKIGGPAGVGALVLDRSLAPTPLVHGGGQERRVHSGTVNAPGIAAFAAAATAMVAELPASAAHMARLRDLLLRGIPERIPEARITGPVPEPGSSQARLPGNVHVVLPGCEGDSLVFLADQRGFNVSNGSACTAGVSQPSHVLLAMGFSEQDARSGLRITVSPSTTEQDVQGLLEVLPDIYRRARDAGMAAHQPRAFTAERHDTRR